MDRGGEGSTKVCLAAPTLIRYPKPHPLTARRTEPVAGESTVDYAI